MRTSHVKPKDVSDLLAQKGKVYGPASKDGGGIPWTVFKHHRELKSFVHALKVLRTEGCLDKVVFTVEDFVNESPRSYHMGKTIDLARRLERSKWWNTFKKNVVKNLLGPKPRKLGPEVSFIVTPCLGVERMWFTDVFWFFFLCRRLLRSVSFTRSISISVPLTPIGIRLTRSNARLCSPSRR